MFCKIYAIYPSWGPIEKAPERGELCCIWMDLDAVNWHPSGYHSSSVAFEVMDDYLCYLNTAGHFLYVSNRMGENELVRLESEIIPKGGPHCFSFYYYLHGTEVPTLNFYLAKGTSFLS